MQDDADDPVRASLSVFGEDRVHFVERVAEGGDVQVLGNTRIGDPAPGGRKEREDIKWKDLEEQ